MNILIFGASGAIGQETAKLALQEGHYVTAFTRSVEKINHLRHNNLSFFQDDILNMDAVLKAVKGKDAVIEVMEGSHRLYKVRVQGTQHIINAMTATGTGRLVCHAHQLPVNETTDYAPFSLKYLIGKLSSANRKADMFNELERIIKNSQLNWTIVRSPIPHSPFAGSQRLPVTAAEKKARQTAVINATAKFILSQVSSDDHNFRKIINFQR